MKLVSFLKASQRSHDLECGYTKAESEASVVALVFQALLSAHQMCLSLAGPRGEASGFQQPHTASASCQLHQVEREKMSNLDARVCLNEASSSLFHCMKMKWNEKEYIRVCYIEWN